MGSFKSLSYFAVYYVSTNKSRIIKVIIISTFILLFVMNSHYPRMFMYYRHVAPLEHTSADIMFDPDALAHALRYYLVERGVTDVDTVSAILSRNMVEYRSLMLEIVNSKVGVKDYLDVYIDVSDVEVGGIVLSEASIVGFDGGSPSLLPMVVFYGGLERGGVLVPLHVLSNVSIGEAVSVGDAELRVSGHVIVSHVLPIINIRPYIIAHLDDLAGSGLNFSYSLTFVDVEGSCDSSLARSVEEELFRAVVLDVAAELGVDVEPGEVVYAGSGAVVCIGDLLESVRAQFERDYGLATSWGVTMVGGLLAFAFYMLRLAWNDVAERMRDSIALAYALGATDGQVAFLLAVNALVYSVPALVLSVLASYAYVNLILGRAGLALPLWVFVDWFSPLVLAGVAGVVAVSVALGLAAVRRQPLARVLAEG